MKKIYTILALFGLVGFLGFYGYYKALKIHYHIPRSYAGWVVVSYSQVECEDGGSKKNVLVIKISDKGFGCTDRVVDLGGRFSKWIEVDNTQTPVGELFMADWDTGERGIWSHVISQARQDELREEFFFVGTESELNNSWGSMPKPRFE
jgi:hypothetical protein